MNTNKRAVFALIHGSTDIDDAAFFSSMPRAKRHVQTILDEMGIPDDDFVEETEDQWRFAGNLDLVIKKIRMG